MGEIEGGKTLAFAQKPHNFFPNNRILVIYIMVVQFRPHNGILHRKRVHTHIHTLLAGNKVGGESPCVVVNRVGKMVSEVL